MIILDTNVVSEPLKPEPHQAVLDWLNAQEPATLYITMINLAELLAGVEGSRRAVAARLWGRRCPVLGLFERRVLDFDAKAAEAFAPSYAGAQAQGNPIGFADCAIAAIARTKGFTVATRNLRDFRGSGVKVMDPWTFV